MVLYRQMLRVRTRRRRNRSAGTLPGGGDSFKDRKPILEVLHDIYDKNVQ